MATSIVKVQVAKTPLFKRGDLVVGNTQGAIILVSMIKGDKFNGAVVYGGINGAETVGQFYTDLFVTSYKPFTGYVTLTQD